MLGYYIGPEVECSQETLHVSACLVTMYAGMIQLLS